MGWISLRQLGEGIVNSRSPYDQQLGAFSGFLSPERKEAYHRINVENLLVATNQNLQSIEGTLRLGLEYNAEILNTNYRISRQLNEIAQETYKQCQEIRNTNRILEEILSTLKSPRATEAAEKARLAAQNIAEAKAMNESRAKRLLDEAIELLNASIEISPFDYKAQFDLGYLYSFYLNDLDNAEKYFDTAVLRSLQKDRNFAVYSLRHLGEVRRQKGNYRGSKDALKEAYDLNAGDIYQTRFEYAQSLALNKEESEAMSHSLSLIDLRNEYFDNCAVDPILLRIVALREKLEQLYDKRHDEVSTNTKNRSDWWKNKYFHLSVKKLFGNYKFKNYKISKEEQENLKKKVDIVVDEELAKLSYKDMKDDSKIKNVHDNAHSAWQQDTRIIAKNRGAKLENENTSVYPGKES